MQIYLAILLLVGVRLTLLWHALIHELARFVGGVDRDDVMAWNRMVTALTRVDQLPCVVPAWRRKSFFLITVVNDDVLDVSTWRIGATEKVFGTSRIGTG